MFLKHYELILCLSRNLIVQRKIFSIFQSIYSHSCQPLNEDRICFFCDKLIIHPRWINLFLWFHWLWIGTCLVRGLKYSWEGSSTSTKNVSLKSWHSNYKNNHIWIRTEHLRANFCKNQEGADSLKFWFPSFFNIW